VGQFEIPIGQLFDHNVPRGTFGHTGADGAFGAVWIDADANRTLPSRYAIASVNVFGSELRPRSLHDT
jgi:hypothetical protein